jgi:hypothetical protein
VAPEYVSEWSDASRSICGREPDDGPQ